MISPKANMYTLPSFDRTLEKEQISIYKERVLSHK